MITFRSRQSLSALIIIDVADREERCPLARMITFRSRQSLSALIIIDVADREERCPLAVALTTCVRLLPPFFVVAFVTSWHFDA